MSTSIQDQIETSLRQARRARDEATKNVIGMLKSRVVNRMKDGSGAEETDALWLEVITAYAKELKKSMVKLGEAGERGVGLLAEAQFELTFCEAFLPKKLDVAATEARVRAVAAEQGIRDPKQVGRLVGAVMKAHAGEVEAAQVKEIAVRVLSEGA